MRSALARSIRLAVIAVALASSQVAGAQSIGSSEINLFVSTANGKPALCGLDFTFVYRDTLNRQGAVGAVNGSLSWSSRPNNLAMLLKFTAMDFPGGATQPPSPFDVAVATLSSGSAVMRPQSRVPSDTSPQTFLGVFFLPDSAGALQDVERGDVRLRFNRQPGQLDYEFPISVMASSATIEQRAAFSACLQDILRDGMTVQ